MLGLLTDRRDWCMLCLQLLIKDVDIVCRDKIMAIILFVSFLHCNLVLYITENSVKVAHNVL